MVKVKPNSREMEIAAEVWSSLRTRKKVAELLAAYRVELKGEPEYTPAEARALMLGAYKNGEIIRMWDRDGDVWIVIDGELFYYSGNDEWPRVKLEHMAPELFNNLGPFRRVVSEDED